MFAIRTSSSGEIEWSRKCRVWASGVHRGPNGGLKGGPHLDDENKTTRKQTERYFIRAASGHHDAGSYLPPFLIGRGQQVARARESTCSSGVSCTGRLVLGHAGTCNNGLLSALLVVGCEGTCYERMVSVCGGLVAIGQHDFCQVPVFVWTQSPERGTSLARKSVTQMVPISAQR